ncbi:MAG: DNA polymerase I [Planctomycetota bacterium]|nr:DNA polymerase I [Planctomycetota bacterium]
MPPRFYIIDSHGQLYASYYAIRELTSPTGEPTNATYGFVATLLKILREEKPDYLAACFDLPGPTHRHELFEEYKAQRKPMPTDLIVQIERVREILGLMGIPQVESPGFEADDCIATLARQARAAGMEAVICSRDKDLEQLVGPGVTMLDTKTFERLDAEGIMKRRGVRPEQMQDVLALMGDASDNIPGVPGIGDKTAVKLVAQYGSLEGVLAHADEIKGKLGERLRQHKEDALRSHELVRLEAAVPLAVDLEACRTPTSFDRRPLVALLRGLGFNKYVEEFQLEVASGGTGIKVHVVDTPAALAKLAKALAAQDAFAFDTETTSLSPYQARLVGMSFAWAADEGYYVPLLGPEPQRCLSLEAVRKALGPILSGDGGWRPKDFGLLTPSHEAARLLVGQNVKYDMLVCRRAGIELAEPLFDTMVAAYLSNPGRREYNLDALALDYFGFKKIPLESLLGKKRTERTMDQAPIDQVAEYSVEDAVITWRLKGELERELAEKGLADLARNVEMPLVPVLASMEEIGVAVDKGVLADIAANLDGRLAKLEKEIYAAAGHEFAINSPQQLAAILFEELGLRPLRRTAKGGRPSTDADVLEDLAARHPLPRLVLGFRQLAKLKGTYVDALPALVEPETGRIHTSFNQTVTATGRLSSSDPNLQNIPIRTEEGRQVRRAFVPRPILTQGGMPSTTGGMPGTLFAGHADAADAPHAHAKSGVGMPPESGGWLLLAADYSQIELRMLAHYSDDPALVRAFAEDRDIHTFVAHQIYGVPEAEVSADQRRAAKIVNFSLIYGKTAYGLSRDLGIGVTEAEQFIDGYFERYRGVRTFTADVLERAKKDGYVTTILGRRRYIEGIEQMDPKRLNFPERTAINTVIQGSAADLIKVAMNRIWRRGRRENRPSRLLIQIHDELIFETPEASLAAEQQWIEAEMTRAMELKVPLRVHVATGRNWMEAE